MLAAAFTNAAKAADEDRLKAFLSVTGFDVALESLRLGASDAPQMLGLEASDFGVHWSRIADAVFEPEAIKADALRVLGAALDDEMLSHAAAFYATDLGQRLVIVENAAHSTESNENEVADGEAIVADLEESNSPRLKTLRRMNVAIDPENTGIRAAQEVQIRFLLAASDAEVIDRIDEAALRALMEEQASEMKDEMEHSALVSAAAVYAPFSDTELASYADALEDPVMQKVYELMNGVQYALMADRYEKLALKMAGLTPGEEL